MILPRVTNRAVINAAISVPTIAVIRGSFAPNRPALVGTSCVLSRVIDEEVPRIVTESAACFGDNSNRADVSGSESSSASSMDLDTPSMSRVPLGFFTTRLSQKIGEPDSGSDGVLTNIIGT